MSHRPGTDDRSAKADSEEQQHAVKRSFREIMREISPAALRETAIQGEMDLLDELETRLAQIRRKSHVAWYRFPELLVAYSQTLFEYGAALVEQGNRIAKLPDMPRKSRPLRKFNDVDEWKESHEPTDARVSR
jgi:hypothetical protein